MMEREIEGETYIYLDNDREIFSFLLPRPVYR